jgi:hypothetical protein
VVQGARQKGAQACSREKTNPLLGRTRHRMFLRSDPSAGVSPADPLRRLGRSGLSACSAASASPTAQAPRSWLACAMGVSRAAPADAACTLACMTADRRNEVIRVLGAGVGAPLALAIAAWPHAVVVSVTIGLIGAVVGVLFAFGVEQLLDRRAELQRLRGRVTEVEAEIDNIRKLNTLLEHQTRVAQAKAGINAIWMQAYGGALQEAAKTAKDRHILEFRVPTSRRRLSSGERYFCGGRSCLAVHGIKRPRRRRVCTRSLVSPYESIEPTSRVAASQTARRPPRSGASRRRRNGSGAAGAGRLGRPLGARCSPA